MFNILPRDVPDERARATVARLLLWYLPPKYKVFRALAEEADRDGADLLPARLLA